MGTAIYGTVGLKPVSYDPHPAIVAGGRKGMDGTLEAVVGMSIAHGRSHLKSLVVLVAAHLALGHVHVSSLRHYSTSVTLLYTKASLLCSWVSRGLGGTEIGAYLPYREIAMLADFRFALVAERVLYQSTNSEGV